MKNAVKVLKACLASALACVCLAACSSDGSFDARYKATGINDEQFNVAVDDSKGYTIENPTESLFVVLNSDGENVATVQMIASDLYDMYKVMGSSSTSYILLDNDGVEGFSFSSVHDTDGDEYTYNRCYKLTDNTALYLESLVSDDMLDEVAKMFEFKIA